nr:40S ribosomal protein S4 [Ipomoea trifida]
MTTHFGDHLQDRNSWRLRRQKQFRFKGEILLEAGDCATERLRLARTTALKRLVAVETRTQTARGELVHRRLESTESRRRSQKKQKRRRSVPAARGLKKHMKRLNAPKHWMLDKLGGAFAPKPSSGPHKSRECLPLILIIRNRLKYALTYREVISILMQRHVLVDGKVRTDKTYPAGFMDVVSIPKTNENFRLLYDTKGRFRLHSIRDEEAKFKLCKVRSVQFGKKGIPYINTYDGRTIRYPDPLIKANDTVKLDLESNKIVEFIKFDVGNVVMVTGGRNRGRVGVIKNREKHKGSFETVHIQDALGHEFATRLGNVFTIGKGTKPWVSLPKGKGIKLTIIEEAKKRLAAQSATTA